VSNAHRPRGGDRRIDAAIEAARGGVGRTIILLGEAGVGKSRLVHEAGARAERKRVRVLWGHCAEVRISVKMPGRFA